MTLSPTSWPAGKFSAGANPSCVLQKTGNLDVHALGNHALLWTRLADNQWDSNALTAIPAGLGLTFLFDGTSATLTTTEAGVWVFNLGISMSAADAAWRGAVGDGIGLLSSEVPAMVGANSFDAEVTGIGALPAGATGNPVVNTTVAATANPYNLSSAFLAITRLG